jgi:ATP-dependent Clp protease ATP-binding subunit ClpA
VKTPGTRRGAGTTSACRWPAARAWSSRARQEAARLGAPAIESDHLLLGLALEANGPAAEAISACSLSDEAIRAQLDGPPGAPDKVQRPRPSLSHQALAVPEDALREALGQGAEKLDCDHLLLALLREPGGRGQRLVMGLGTTPRAVERRLNRAREKRAAREATPVTAAKYRRQRKHSL